LNSCLLNYYNLFILTWAFWHDLQVRQRVHGFLPLPSGAFVRIRETSHIVTVLATCLPHRLSAGTEG